MKILIVEDEEKLLREIEKLLSENGFATDCAQTLSAAKQALTSKPDLILLDRQLPDGDGIDFLKQLHIKIPVIMLTARVDTLDKVLGLELGANDYVTKPFEPQELLARIRVQVRTLQAGTLPATAKLKCGEIEVDVDARRVFFSGKEISLARLEFDLLKLLIEAPGRVFSRQEIMNRVWGRNHFEPSKTLDFHIKTLRKKMDPAYFETVHGVGFRFQSNKSGDER